MLTSHQSESGIGRNGVERRGPKPAAGRQTIMSAPSMQPTSIRCSIHQSNVARLQRLTDCHRLCAAVVAVNRRSSRPPRPLVTTGTGLLRRPGRQQHGSFGTITAETSTITVCITNQTLNPIPVLSLTLQPWAAPDF